jgi:hypothetical protein
VVSVSSQVVTNLKCTEVLEWYSSRWFPANVVCGGWIS